MNKEVQKYFGPLYSEETKDLCEKIWEEANLVTSLSYPRHQKSDRRKKRDYLLANMTRERFYGISHE